MKQLSKVDRQYNVCVIDIGSPKLGNIGWCIINTETRIEANGSNLDELFTHIKKNTRCHGLILGLEAPLFVPIRRDLILALKARTGEGKRPWSAGAGAQVLAMNLPIMIYIFNGIKSTGAKITYSVNEETFRSQPNEIMLFEALVSGEDKGNSHIDDAKIMARSCSHFAKNSVLPPSILEHEEGTEYFNIAAAALIRCGLEKDPSALSLHTPIYKPRR